MDLCDTNITLNILLHNAILATSIAISQGNKLIKI